MPSLHLRIDRASAASRSGAGARHNAPTLEAILLSASLEDEVGLTIRLQSGCCDKNVRVKGEFL